MIERRLATDWERRRLGLLGAVCAAGFAILFGRLWWMQVARGEQYRSHLERQSVRRVRLPAPRGRLYDRRGRLLADNRPSYDLVLYIEELRQRGGWPRTLARIEETIAEIERRVGLPREPDARAVQLHVQKRLPLPLVVRRDLDETARARWAELAAELPGVDLLVQPLRVYPAGAAAAHVVGYVGRADIEPDPEMPFHYALPDTVGRAGVERRYDARLRGQPGGRLVRVDASGFRHDDLAQIKPTGGEDLMLTIDLELQRRLAEILANKHGAAVVLDPITGDVLAAYSAPAFDPNALIPTISADQWNVLTADPGRPLFNRAFSGAYPPGSTFKPIVALAAARSGADLRDPLLCEGRLQVGNRPFLCWDRAGHGPLDAVAGLRQSCNVYFYRIAMQIGPEPIVAEARRLGLGRLTGIDADGESEGFLPDPAWMRRVQRRSWSGGDTANLSIGQGAVVTTPLQMAVVAAALANGGQRVRPRLVRARRASAEGPFEALPPAPPEDMGWPPEATRLVREGMRQAVHHDQGTARLARLAGIELAAKTGTAQYGPEQAMRKRGWTIAFAPFDTPRMAVAVVVDDAVSGGLTAAPLVRDILAAFFGEANGRESTL